MKEKNNILVCYATRYGSTKQVAEIIGDSLSEKGYNVRISSLLQKIVLSDIGAVFIGSPLHLGKWLPEAKEFLQFRKVELKGIPVFSFTTGITLSDPTEHNLLKAKSAIDEISVYIKPQESGFFAGKISTDALSETDKDLVKIAGIKDGDYINPDEIIRWTTDICERYSEDLLI